MNISTFLRSLANLKSENISNSQHFRFGMKKEKMIEVVFCSLEYILTLSLRKILNKGIFQFLG